MKKIIFQIFIGLLLFSCASKKGVENRVIDNPTNEKEINYDYAGKIKNDQLNYIKRNYKWNDDRILIINYSQPGSSCYFDNNTITKAGKKWWNDFYSKINTENCLNIHVLASGEKTKKKLDNINYFDDKNDFLLNNFFDRKKSCFGLLVINAKGDYIQFNGHYSKKQVAKYIKVLKN